MNKDVWALGLILVTSALVWVFRSTDPLVYLLAGFGVFCAVLFWVAIPLERRIKARVRPLKPDA